jgi:hypothetical protein
MGNFHISVQGVGCHHNKIEKDADAMAKKFVKELLEAGHAVMTATITYGGAEDIKAASVQESSSST